VRRQEYEQTEKSCSSLAQYYEGNTFMHHLRA
jgi:hypothetical protein